MALSIIVYLSWLCISVFYAMKKPYTKLENSALIFCLFLIDLNRGWITNDELKYATYSTAPLNYTGYILYRTFIAPFLLLIGINCIPRNSSALKKVIASLISSFVLVLINIFLLKFDVVDFHQWNLLYVFVNYVLLHLIGYFILYCYKSFVLKGETNK